MAYDTYAFQPIFIWKNGDLILLCPWTESLISYNPENGKATKLKDGKLKEYTYSRYLAYPYVGNLFFPKTICKLTMNNHEETKCIRDEEGTIMANRKQSTGRVKWITDNKGFNFIMPNNKGKDMFIHQYTKSSGNLSLEAEKVESQTECGDDGTMKATNISGPGRSSVKARTRNDSYGGCDCGRGTRGGDGYGCGYTYDGEDGVCQHNGGRGYKYGDGQCNGCGSGGGGGYGCGYTYDGKDGVCQNNGGRGYKYGNGRGSGRYINGGYQYNGGGRHGYGYSYGNRGCLYNGGRHYGGGGNGECHPCWKPGRNAGQGSCSARCML